MSSTQYPPPVYYSSKPRRPLSPMDVGILVLILLGCVGCILLFALYMVAFSDNLTNQPPLCATNEFGSPIILNGCATQVYGAPSLVETLPTATPLPLIQPSPLPPLQPTAVPPTATPVCYLRTDLPVYIVRAGDTVFSIAQVTGSTVDEIRVWNCMADVNRIDVGQVLYVRMLPSGVTAAFVPGGMPQLGSNLYGTNINVCQNNQVTIQFANNTTTATRYLWSLGDGSTSTETNPQHVYTIARNGVTSFNVTLTAYGWDGNPYSTTAMLMFTPHCP
ncbi:MAG: PKD domain-containing protein [Chloroflexota bacterium]|nr:PKD domain-containing protein [Chloroflexota bacterium]